MYSGCGKISARQLSYEYANELESKCSQLFFLAPHFYLYIYLPLHSFISSPYYLYLYIYLSILFTLPS